MTNTKRFESLYKTYFSRVYSYFSLCFDPHRAQDLAQQTFLNVWKALARSKMWNGHIENERAWIFRIAVNVKNDELRKKQRRPPTQELIETLSDSQSSQETMVESAQIAAAFAQLSLEDREILLMKNMGLTSREIAEVLRISASAVRSRISGARERFSQILIKKGVEV